MEYISIIIVIVGFLFSLFQKEKEKQEDNGKKAKKKNAPVNMPDIKKQVMKRVEQTLEAPVRKETVPVPNELDAIKKERDALKKKLKLMERNIARSQHEHKQQEILPIESKDLLNGSNLAEAVILSEIIGPPRAKRPHPATRKKQMIKQ